MKVTVKEVMDFIKSHNLGYGCQTQSEEIAMQDAFISGLCLDVPDNYWDMIIDRDARQKVEQQKRDNAYQEISGHRLNGMSLEKSGDYEAAIDEYAQSIRLGMSSEYDMLHAYHHSFNRIIVLLGKVKRYAEELEYIKMLSSLTKDDAERCRMAERAKKTIVKLNRQIKDAK